MKTISSIKKLNCSVLTFLAMTIITTLGEDGNRQRTGSPEGQLQLMDKNQDGRISSDEFYGSNETFSQLDIDNSGYVTLTELESWDRKGASTKYNSKRQRNPQKMLDRMDANKDGKLSKEEFRGRPEKFDKIDTDNDGFLSIEELEKRPRRGGNRSFGRLGGGGRGFGSEGF